MPRYHNINGVRTQFTSDEEAARDTEIATEAVKQADPVRLALAAISTLEAAMTPRRLRDHLDGSEANTWWATQTALIATERGKL